MRARQPALTAFGLGGLDMERAGLDRVVRAEEVAVMGITEILLHVPRIYREYRRLVAALKARRPAAAILIDFPDVNFRLAKHCKRLGIPVVWFVSPQLWAWKRRRLHWVQQRVDRMMVIFPFEEPFYKARGVEAEFVGHPLATLAMPLISREDYASANGLSLNRSWVALLPGSRFKEVHGNLPIMLDAANELGSQHEYIVPVASTLRSEDILQLLRLREQTRKRPGPAWPGQIRLVHDARAALQHSRAAIVASGTATVQAALIGNPFVVVYRVSPLTFRLAKRLVHYPAEITAPLDEWGNLPIAMVNLIAGRRIVPELLQDQFTGANVAAALRPLLEDGSPRETMIRDLKEVRQRLTVGNPPDGIDPIRRVCDAVQSLIYSPSRKGGENAPSIV